MLQSFMETSVDRKLSIATLIVLALQIFAGIWWAATITRDVEDNTQFRVANAALLIRLEERTGNMSTDIDRMVIKQEALLDVVRRGFAEQLTESRGPGGR